MGFPSSATASAGTCPEWTARVVSIEGRVEALPAGDTQWRTVALNDTLCPEDQIRTLEKSRAALQLRNETMLRLDQNTMVKFPGAEPESSSLLNLITGRAFFMTRFPRPLTIETPYVNASSGGTEYVIEVDKEHQTSTLTVIEGIMHLKNAAGTLTVTGGQSSITRAGEQPVLRILVNPKDALRWALYYPPVLNLRDLHLDGTEALPATDWRVMVVKSIAAYESGDLEKAFAALAGVPGNIEDRRLYNYHASLLLAVGRVDEAKSDIERSLTLAPRNGLALALQSLIAVVQNQSDKALNLAQEAAAAEPESASVRIALSYAWQANFNLPQALTAAQDATRLDLQAALAWARTAELWLSQGYLTEALDAAKRAETLNPSEARIQTVLGFAYLTQIRVEDARAVFEQAIAFNSSDPLPRLGLGLAKIREGDLSDGRKEIEIAAALDPGNALIRSYLGKAYYEEKRDQRAAVQFELAKKLDPKDPTPYLYDAVRKQTRNRPVEALHDLQKSIELNDNRAPYRSRLLLDDDLATRSVGQGRIYDDLGFGHLALVEGWKSVSIDPANYSAHRFLADTYATLPNSRIARLSSLLQSQLLQPINNDPVQPRLGDSAAANLLVGVRPVNASFNEYSQLFTRDGTQLLASGLAGGNDTLGEELIASGLHGRYSYSLGQSHYSTDGYRPNADIKNTSYNAFAQVALSPKAGIQAEYRHNHTENGDLDLRFDPLDFSKTKRRNTETNTARLGFHYKYSPYSQTIASAFYQDSKDKTDISDPLPLALNATEHMYGGEAQQLSRTDGMNIIVGLGYFEGDTKQRNTFMGKPSSTDTDNRYSSAYIYTLSHIPHDAILTLGGSANIFKGSPRSRDQFNPKVGLLWNITPATTLRAAYFRVLSRQFASDQTIEPAQVAGFQQFFDDFEISDSTRYGIGIDQKFSPSLFGGIEASKRDVKIPYTKLPTMTVSLLDTEERQGSAYVAWTPYNWMAARADYFYEWYHQDDPTVSVSDAPKMRTQRLPLGLNFYHPSGLFAKVTETYFDQRLSVLDPITLKLTAEGDNFWLTDLTIGYRLPGRLGIVSVEVNNIFDQNFRYQDVSASYPSILPERVVYSRLTLLF
jgi:tetratricopeptide (TPR) repeat protein